MSGRPVCAQREGKEEQVGQCTGVLCGMSPRGAGRMEGQEVAARSERQGESWRLPHGAYVRNRPGVAIWLIQLAAVA